MFLLGIYVAALEKYQLHPNEMYQCKRRPRDRNLYVPVPAQSDEADRFVGFWYGPLDQRLRS